MNRQNFFSAGPWEDIVGYSRAVKVFNHIEVSGTTAIENNKVVHQGDAYQQTIFILKKIEQALHGLGAGINHINRTRIFVTDIGNWEAVGRAHGEFFKNVKPASTMIEVKSLILEDLLVEIEATAIID